VQALLIDVGGDWYALGLASVREVLPVPELTPAPGGPPALRGLFNLRGTVLPLLDTGSLLGLERSPAAYAVVVDTGTGPAGLTAGAMPRTARLEEPAGAGELPGTVARFSTDAVPVATLLDVDALVERLRA
jgi:purine-binding chemotaxis protein CheW